MSTLLKTCLVITVIGAINWGLIAFFDYNLVESIFGEGELLTRIIYALVFASGIISLAILSKDLDMDTKRR